MKTRRERIEEYYPGNGMLEAARMADRDIRIEQLQEMRNKAISAYGYEQLAAAFVELVDILLKDANK